MNCTLILWLRSPLDNDMPFMSRFENIRLSRRRFIPFLYGILYFSHLFALIERNAEITSLYILIIPCAGIKGYFSLIQS